MTDERIEIRDGKEFKVTVLPDAKPPAKRAATSRYHMAEVEKPGEIGPAKGFNKFQPKRRRRKKA